MASDDGSALPAAWTPQGLALLDHHHGRRPAVVVVHTGGGESEDVDASDFFRGEEQLDPWEQLALERCGARVLDLGAGAGQHTLALQARGRRVTALDSCPECVQVMQLRGVEDAREGELASLASDHAFDTVLLLMHGAGVAGDLDGLRALLVAAGRVLGPAGELLVDSRDPGEACADGEVDGVAVAELQMEYRGRRGRPFPWLFLSAQALAALADDRGWRTHVLHRDADGRYLACLSRSA